MVKPSKKIQKNSDLPAESEAQQGPEQGQLESPKANIKSKQKSTAGSPKGKKDSPSPVGPTAKKLKKKLKKKKVAQQGESEPPAAPPKQEDDTPRAMEKSFKSKDSGKDPHNPWCTGYLTVQERMADVFGADKVPTGRCAQDFLRGRYVTGRKTLKFYLKNGNATGGVGGEKVFKRHRLNNRNLVQHRMAIKSGVKEKGFVVGGRSEVITIPPFQEAATREVVGGAHVIEAIYDAADDEPNNPQILATLEGGMETTELDWRTPDDVIKEFKEIANSMVNASGKCFLEKYHELDTMEDSLTRKRKDAKRDLLQHRANQEKLSKEIAGTKDSADADPAYLATLQQQLQKVDNLISLGSCLVGTKEYEACYLQHIRDDFEKSFTKYEHVKAGKSFKRAMLAHIDPDKTSQSLWQWFEEYMSEHAIFTDIQDDGVLFILFHGIYVNLEKHGLLRAIKPLIKFAVPTDDRTPHLIKVRNDLDKVKCLLQPVKGTKIHQANDLEWKMFANPPPVVAPALLKPKAAGMSAQAKPKAKPQPKMKAKPEDLNLTSSDGQVATLLHNILQTVEKGFKNLPSAVSSIIPDIAPERCTLWLLEFGLEGKVMLPKSLTDSIAQDPTTWTGESKQLSAANAARRYVAKLIGSYVDAKFVSATGEKREAKPKKKGKNGKSSNKKIRDDGEGPEGADTEDDVGGNGSDDDENEGEESDGEGEDSEDISDNENLLVDGVDSGLLQTVLQMVKNSPRLLGKFETFMKENPINLCNLESLNMLMLKKRHRALDNAARDLWSCFDSTGGTGGMSETLSMILNKAQEAGANATASDAEKQGDASLARPKTVEEGIILEVVRILANILFKHFNPEFYRFARLVRRLLGYEAAGSSSTCTLQDIAAINPKLSKITDVWGSIGQLDTCMMARTVYVIGLVHEMHIIVTETVKFEGRDEKDETISTFMRILDKMEKFLKTFAMHVAACDPASLEIHTWIQAWYAILVQYENMGTIPYAKKNAEDWDEVKKQLVSQNNAHDKDKLLQIWRGLLKRDATGDEEQQIQNWSKDEFLNAIVMMSMDNMKALELEEEAKFNKQCQDFMHKMSEVHVGLAHDEEVLGDLFEERAQETTTSIIDEATNNFVNLATITPGSFVPISQVSVVGRTGKADRHAKAQQNAASKALLSIEQLALDMDDIMSDSGVDSLHVKSSLNKKFGENGAILGKTLFTDFRNIESLVLPIRGPVTLLTPGQISNAKMQVSLCNLVLNENTTNVNGLQWQQQQRPIASACRAREPDGQHEQGGEGPKGAEEAEGLAAAPAAGVDGQLDGVAAQAEVEKKEVAEPASSNGADHATATDAQSTIQAMQPLSATEHVAAKSVVKYVNEFKFLRIPTASQTTLHSTHYCPAWNVKVVPDLAAKVAADNAKPGAKRKPLPPPPTMVPKNIMLQVDAVAGQHPAFQVKQCCLIPNPEYVNFSGVQMADGVYHELTRLAFPEEQVVLGMMQEAKKRKREVKDKKTQDEGASEDGEDDGGPRDGDGNNNKLDNASKNDNATLDEPVPINVAQKMAKHLWK